MHPGVARTVTVLVAFIALILGLLFFRAYQPPKLDTHQLQRWNMVWFDEARNLPDFNLIDDQGQAFGREQLLGQWTLGFFGFTHCPDICPTTLALLSQVKQRLPDKPLQYVLVSVDPERDTPDKLGEYVDFFDPDFIGVTGEEGMIRALGLTLSIVFSKVPLPNGDYTVDHSGYVVLINPQGQYVGFFRAPHRVANIAQSLSAIFAAKGS